MRMLLLAGLGPYDLSTSTLVGTLFAPADGLRDAYRRLAGFPVELDRLHYGGPDGKPVLRPYRESIPCLSLQTVRSIVETTDVELEVFDLADLWQGAEPLGGAFDVVGVSTTYICDAATLKRLVRWITARFPAATLVLGGQFSNLKYAEILARHAEVDYVVRGDAELALPRLLRGLAGDGDVGSIPNLVARDAQGRPVATPVEYIDLEAHSSPVFHGRHAVVPYESMRGCPFSCKFCSFPAASPLWRHKSAERIVRDWRGYVASNGAGLIRAMDSTFTVPRTRFRELLALLPDADVGWEAYTRANSIDTPAIVEALEAAHCRGLFIGFESMSDVVLKAMDKKVSAAQNTRAFELLADSEIDLKASFIAGYPGETPADYEVTHRFLIERFRGKFQVHTFTLVDETMPVWQDAERFGIEVESPRVWKHTGMDSQTASDLRERTVTEVRWKNDDAVLNYWQQAYARPLLGELGVRRNRRVEKLVEQLAYLVKDWGDGEAASVRCHGLLAELQELGIELADAPAGGSEQRAATA